MRFKLCTVQRYELTSRQQAHADSRVCSQQALVRQQILERCNSQAVVCSEPVGVLSCAYVSTRLQDTAREIFLAKQANERKEKWVMGNYIFFRMHRITDIYFVGGFGTVQWIDVNEYLTATPDAIATNSPAVTLQVRVCACTMHQGCLCFVGCWTGCRLQRMATHCAASYLIQTLPPCISVCVRV